MKNSEKYRFCSRCKLIIIPKKGYDKETGSYLEKCRWCGESNLLPVTICDICNSEFPHNGDNICPKHAKEAKDLWDIHIRSLMDNLSEEQLDYLEKLTDGELLFKALK